MSWCRDDNLSERKQYNSYNDIESRELIGGKDP